MTTQTRPSPSLPAIAPGPGAYMQTPTIKEEREMRALSKQVVTLVRQRQNMQAGQPPLDGAAPKRMQRSRTTGGLASQKQQQKLASQIAGQEPLANEHSYSPPTLDLADVSG